MNSNTILTLRNLVIGYDNDTILQSSINAILKKGQITCIIGRNGSGKTTLIKTITGILKPISGEIFWFEKEFSTYRISYFPYLFSVVFTDNSGFYGMKVKDILITGKLALLGFFGRLKREDYVHIEEIIDQTNLRSIENKYFENLSDGEKQKTLIARAIVQNAPVIILDEPVAHLDILGKYEILTFLRNYVITKEKTVIFSSHEIDIAFRFADNVWLLGKNDFYNGNPEELLYKNKIQDVFTNQKFFLDTCAKSVIEKESNYKEIFLKCPLDIRDIILRGLSRHGFIESKNRNEYQACLEIIEKEENIFWQFFSWDNRKYEGIGFEELWELLRNF